MWSIRFFSLDIILDYLFLIGDGMIIDPAFRENGGPFEKWALDLNKRALLFNSNEYRSLDCYSELFQYER